MINFNYLNMLIEFYFITSLEEKVRIAERPGGKIKHGCDTWIVEPELYPPVARIGPRFFPGTARALFRQL
jgi:hypothetical protein